MTASDHKPPVTVGMLVRVLVLPESLMAQLPDDEVQQLKSMLGAVLEIDEIDERGVPWVTKWFGDEGGPRSHSLALAKGEYEIVKQ